MTPVQTGEELYQEREQRFNKIVALQKPDRVPVVPLVITYFAERWKGIPYKEAAYDHPQHFELIKAATVEFGWDFTPTNGLLAADGYDALGCTQIQWPGGTLPDNVGFQFVEDEYMKADEYDEFLAAPDRFTATKIWPRMGTNLAGLGAVPLPPLHWLANSYYLMNLGGQIMSIPPIRQALQSLLDMADAVAGHFAADVANAQEMAALGYPRTWSAPIVPPFDIVSDFLRSLRGSTMDMFRHPEQLLATIDVMTQAQIGVALTVMQLTGNPRCFIPMHRGAGGFMSNDQFEKFYWPSFEALVLAIIEAGGVPCPLFEGDYTPRLEYLAQFPAGKIAGHFDKVDRVKFKEVLGDKMCFWGNVPASLLCTGTPQQVKDDVKELIELFGDTGTLMLDSGLGVPDEARPENMLALREAADEYGVL
jgi:Uroporphyrinogen decarboxylase (URO-D)